MYVHVREWNARRRRTGTVRTDTQTASEFVRGKVASSFDATRSLVTAFYDSLWCGNYHDSQQRSRGGGKERGESMGRAGPKCRDATPVAEWECGQPTMQLQPYQTVTPSLMSGNAGNSSPDGGRRRLRDRGKAEREREREREEGEREGEGV